MDPRAPDDLFDGPRRDGAAQGASRPAEDADLWLGDDDRDLALARTLDTSGALRAGDRFEAALGSLRSMDVPADSARVDALRARVLAATTPADEAPGRADRSAVRHARPGTRRLPVVLGAVFGVFALVAVAWWIGVARPSAPALIAEAPAGKAVTATLPGDNGTAVLDGGSRLASVETDGADATVRLDGVATFDVAHRPERHFAVTTPAGTVTVLGTRFRVVATDRATTVVLERGSVRLSTASGETATLVPGQTATLRDGRITPPAPADGVVAETDAGLSFRRTSARAVADVLAARTGLVVRLPADVAAETVSGSLALGDDRAALDAFADVLGGRFVADGSDRAVRFERTR